jgi:predicted lactoylglutathione lyase
MYLRFYNEMTVMLLENEPPCSLSVNTMGTRNESQSYLIAIAMADRRPIDAVPKNYYPNGTKHNYSFDYSKSRFFRKDGGKI